MKKMNVLSGRNLNYRLRYLQALLPKLLFMFLVLFVVIPAKAGIAESYESENLEQNPKKASGIVKDVNGEPIPGATVLVEGTTIGTITGIDGSFFLTDVQIGSRLVFSFVGMKSVTVEFSGQGNIEIVMSDDTKGLEEVVVVGYGTQKKASVVGAISSIKGEEMVTIASANLTNTIGGMTTGVFTKMGEGKPGGDDAQLTIRGVATPNNNNALVLVDGIESDFGRINPNDIESFSVLKDASATAVYGVRGANGVILITTKRGARGKGKISVNSQVRLHRVIKYPEFLDSYDWARLRNEAQAHANGAYINGSLWNPRYVQEDLDHFKNGTDPYGHPSINWFDELTKPYYYEHRHDIGVKGGTDKVKYYVSAEFVSQEGAYKQWSDQKYNSNSTYDRLNLRTNFDFTVTKTTTIDVSMSNRIEMTNDVKSGTVGEVSERGGIWDDIMALPPNNNPLHNPNGTYGAPSGEGTALRPYATLRQGGYLQSRGNYFQGAFKLTQKLDALTQGLSFRVMTGINSRYRYNYEFDEFPSIWEYNPVNEEYTQVSREVLPSSDIPTGKNVSQQIYHTEGAFDYNRTFGVHEVGALAMAYQDKTINKSVAPLNHIGFAGRISYGYDSKYLAELNIGYNGSDRFAKGQRYAWFPAMSLGWVVTQEKFMQNQNVFKYMKIRGSYGTVGNDKIGTGYDYYYAHLFNEFGNNRNYGYYFGDPLNKYGMIREGTLGNDQVTWETAVKQNYGIDFNIISDNLSISFDYFIENRDNILYQRSTVPSTMGHEGNKTNGKNRIDNLLPPENFGKVKSEGFELSARFKKQLNDWNFNLNGNFSYAKNIIIDLDEIKQEYDYQNATGKSLGQYFGYMWTGEFYTYEELGYVWDEALSEPNKYTIPTEGLVPSVPVPSDAVFPGDLKFVDRNEDGVINSLDIGDISYANTPEIIYGLTLGVGYKNWNFSMFWQGASRFSVNYGNSAITTEFKNGGGAHEVHLGRWAYFPEQGIDTRELATYPRLAFDGSGQTRHTSTFKVHDATYVRLKSVELSYSLSQNIVEKLRLGHARFFLTGNNLLTFDNIGYLDPEMPGSSAAYPQSMFFGFGVNVGF